MDYTRQNDHYAVRLAGNLLNCCENGTADFLNPSPFPYYTQDMLSSQALRDASQLQTLLNNAAHGTQYINYAPTYIFQDSKSSWMNNLRNNEKDNGDSRDVGCIVYKGKDENGNKRYEMMTPAGRINPAGVNESPMTQDPVPDIGIYRQTPSLDPRDPKGIENYITGVIGNYFNAAFTKTPYYPPQWGGQETEMLSKALNADPSIALRSAQQAYTQATSVKMENTVNQELNDNVREAIRQGLPPFNTKKQEAIIGPVNINGVPSNGIDFVNSYYNNLNGNATAAAAQNGYIPYQTHNEHPKNIDKFLVEQYSNIMNAALTGTPYSGSIHPSQLKNLSSGIEAKMANDPAYMSGIVNQAQQNVVGFNYMPYDKEDFISRARDPSSREFKLLNETIAIHINDILKNNKVSFNGEFQELSKDLTEKIRNTNTERKPSARTAAGGASSANKGGNPSAGAAAAKEEKKPSTRTAAGAGTAKKGATPSAGPAAAKDERKPSPGRAAAGASAAKKGANPSAGVDAAKEERNPSTRTAAAGAGAAGRTKEPSVGANNANEERKPSARMAAAGASTANNDGNPSVAANNEQKEGRPSFIKEVTDFVKKNIVEKKPSLVLMDTFLGTVLDKAKKIVRTGKTIAAAFVIAANVLAPNLNLPIANYLPKAPISISVNQNDFKSAARGAAVKAGETVRQIQHVKSAARR